MYDMIYKRKRRIQFFLLIFLVSLDWFVSFKLIENYWNSFGLINISPSKVFMTLLIPILIRFLWRIRPQNIYCKGCGQWLGKDNNYNMPCQKCKGNIWSYEFVGVGTTVKIQQKS